MPDSAHWLWRLSADAWLAAAHRELELGRAQVGARRTAVTHARRAAGMALNGVLVCMSGRGWGRERCESVWGRSYVDHLRVLAGGEVREPFDVEVCLRCRELLGISVMPAAGLVELGGRKGEAGRLALAGAGLLVRDCEGVIGG